MNDWKTYARARDQIYHYGVALRKMHSEVPAARRTPELVQLMEIMETAVDQAKEAWEAGEILSVDFNRWAVLPLPGFEDYDEELKKPRWDNEA